MNIIEKRRRKAWVHATMVIMNKVIREASTGTIFIYGETLYGKDYFLTPDDAWMRCSSHGGSEEVVGAGRGEAVEAAVR